MVAGRWLLRLAHAVLALAVPVVLLFTPLYVMVTPAFVRHEYGLRGFPPADIYTPEERLRLSNSILLYLRGRVTRAELAAMRTQAGAVALRQEEVQHLADVKGVMGGMFVAHRVALALALVSGGVLWLARWPRLIRAGLRQGVAVVGALITLILASSLVNFDAFFTRFHQIFFEAGTWTFYAEDTLIQLYPLPLWTHAAWKYGALVLLVAALIYGLSFAFRQPISSSEQAT